MAIKHPYSIVESLRCLEMAGTPERETERAALSSRPLHNFTLPSRLRWGRQKQLRCVKTTQSSTSRNVPSLSANHLSQQSRSPIPLSRQPPITTSTVSLPTIDKAKSAITSTPEGGTSEIEAIREKLMSDLKVAVNEHLKLGFLEEKAKGKEEEKKPVEEALPWNLRNRQAMGKTTNESGRGLWPVRRNDRGYRSLLSSDKGEASGDSEQERNKFSLALSKSEIEADFLLMTGAKPPRRPKKRSKPVQKQLDGLFPGTWLSEVTPEKYKVPDFPEPKEK